MLRPVTIFLNLVPLAIFAYLSIAGALSWDGPDLLVTTIVITILLLYPLLNIFALLSLGGGRLAIVSVWKKVKKTVSRPQKSDPH